MNLDARARTRLDAFSALVRHWNGAYSLVSRRDASRLETRHIADSLTLVPWVEGTRLGDVGSGAGFPGIPLAIAAGFACLVAAPEGVKALFEAHPDVSIVTAALDRELDDDAFIRPGLGDAGDRIYGT